MNIIIELYDLPYQGNPFSGNSLSKKNKEKLIIYTNNKFFNIYIIKNDL